MNTNIYNINNKYVIKKRIYSKSIIYGTYDNQTEALKQKKKLAKHGWYKNASTGYPPEEHFPKYYVKKTDTGYLVINKQNGKTFGTYQNHKYAKIIKKILPFHEDNINIRLIEKLAHKEFYKYISYHKMNGRYQVIYKGLVRSTHKNIIDALYERDIIVKYDCDEELMCEDPTIIYDYSKEKLPPYKHESENIHYKDENINKYQLEKQIRNHKIIVGHYPTYNLARLIKEYLDERKWDMKEVKHIMKTTRQIHKRDQYIVRQNNKYCIKREHNDKTIIYGYYNDIEKTRYVKNKLEETNWKTKRIQKIERRYYKEQSKTKYYYDKTDFFKITKGVQ